MKNKFGRFSQLILLPLVALLSACGGGGGGDSSTPTTPTAPIVTLNAIAVTPETVTLAVGATQQYVATGTYSDGKSAALTTGVTWSTGGVATTVVPATGLVTGKAIGTDIVTATVGTVVASSKTLTVRGPWAAVAAGGAHTVARKIDGTLYAWGWNRSGQLGDGTTLDKTVPTSVDGTKTWTQFASGELHTVALRSDGTLWAWGYNLSGQLGNDSRVNAAAPIQVGKDKDWSAVAAGKSHTLAVKKDGTLWAWGRNYDGQIGDNSGIDRLVPTKVVTVPAVTTWKSVAGGDTHSMALRTDGTLWTWGGNSKGQLGSNSTLGTSTPARVGTQTWSLIAAGAFHSVAIRADGALFTWGLNSSGQLGTGALFDVLMPTDPIGIARNWAYVSAGESYTLGIKTDGTLWSWGLNENGQLGGSTAPLPARLQPQQVGTAANWLTVSAGQKHAFGIQGDGSLWGWGRNLESQLGNGNFTDVTLPTILP